MGLTQGITTQGVDSLATDRLNKTMARVNYFVNYCQDADSYFSLPPSHAERKSYALRLNGLLFDIYSQLELLIQYFHQNDLSEMLREFYEVMRSSSWIKRCQDRPLGYMGDYMTIEQVLEVRKTSKVDSLGYEIDKSILESSLCQQHRNKINYEVNLMRQSINECEHADILCFSVGGCLHISKNLVFLGNRNNYTLHLHDTYPDAISLSKQRLSPVRDYCQFYTGNLVRFIKKDLLDVKFDLITMGGFMDYITDKVFVLILSLLYKKLKKGGRIYITQLSKNSLYECVMHYILFWDVIYRSEDDLRRVIGECGVPDEKVYIKTDLTNITYLVELSK